MVTENFSKWYIVEIYFTNTAFFAFLNFQSWNHGIDLCEFQKYGFEPLNLRESNTMSASTLQQELKALQANPGFLQAFLPEEMYFIQENAVIEDAEQTSTAPEQPAETEKIDIPKQEATDASGKIESVKLVPANTSTTITEEKTGNTEQTVEAKQLLSNTPKPELKNFAGKYVIWTNQNPTAAERELIKSILKAVQIPFANSTLETTPSPENIDWSTASLVFAFGINVIPGDNNRTLNWKGGKFIKTAALSALIHDVTAKKQLWALLKSTFKL